MANNITYTVKNNITSSVGRIKAKLNDIPRRAYKEWLANTPIKTGNARRSTKFRGKNTISAEYAYAGRLDQGYSKQSPDGMSKPTEQFIQDEISRILARK